MLSLRAETQFCFVYQEKSDRNKEEISLTEHIYPEPSMFQGLC